MRKKFDTIEIQLHNHALEVLINALKALIENIKSGILDANSAYVKSTIEMNKKQIIELHKKTFNYKQSSTTGRWYSYLPKEGVEPPKGKKIEYATEEKLISKIVDYYVKEEKKMHEQVSPPFIDVYWKWRSIHDLRLSDSSISRYNADFPRFFDFSDFGYFPICEISENTIELFIINTVKEQSLSYDGLKNLVMYIHRTFQYARRERIISENPVDFFELKDFSDLCSKNEKSLEEKQYSDEDVNRMLSHLKEQYAKNPRHIINYAIELAIYTGMRLGELAGLKWEDIGSESIYICRTIKYNPIKREYHIGNVKNEKPRHFPINPNITDLLERLKAVYAKYGGLCEWVFATKGNHFTTKAFYSVNMIRWEQLGGKSKSGIHGYRHRLSSNLRTKGVSATVVADIMGHSVRTNDKYYNRNTATIDEMRAIITEEHAKLSA